MKTTKKGTLTRLRPPSPAWVGEGAGVKAGSLTPRREERRLP